ncbi:MAG TPA: aspartate/glutamate racemase family protein, partial [Solirubrobacteraceae bacterium]|jgi:aspartate racemase
MSRAISSLLDAGAERIALPCNTLHALLPEVGAAQGGGLDGRLLSMPALVADALGPAESVLVLGTTATREYGVYDFLRDRGVDVRYPSRARQRELEDLIMSAVRGRTREVRAGLERVVDGDTADAVVIACTDLDVQDLTTLAGAPVVGSLAELSRHCADYLVGARPAEAVR